jgi:adhesin transport system outer membrane protein
MATAPASKTSAQMQSYPDLPSILRHTLRDNPDIGIAWAQERDERTSINIAKAALHPTVNVRAAFGPENYDTSDTRSTGIPRQEYGIDLHQTLYDFGRTKGDISRRKALYNSAGYRRIDKMNKVALEVSLAFLNTLEARQHIAIAKQNIASHQDILRLVSASQKAGNASVADVKRVTTRLEKAKTNLIDLRSRKQSAREEFIRLTGLRPENLSPPPHLGIPLPPKNISSHSYPDNPGLLSVRADIDSLRAQAIAAKANFQPTIDLDVSGNVKRNISGENDMTSGFKGMVSFNYKFLDGGARLNTVRQIHIRIDENKHRYRKKRRDYIQSLENSIRTVRANLQKSSLLATRARDSQKVLNLYKAQFKDGSKTVFELLDAQMDLFTTNSEKIANHYGKLRSIYEIYSLRGDLVGRLLRH